MDGIVDFLENSNIRVFGPNQFASQLEGSKIFTKIYVKNIRPPMLILVFSQKKKDVNNFKSCKFQL